MPVDEIEVDIEDDRDLRLAADGRDGFQDLGRGGARLQPALGRKLVDQAIRQRIAERDAQFEHIYADLVKCQRQLARGLQVRIACADVHDKPLLSLAPKPGKSFYDAVHPGHSFSIHGAGFKWQVAARPRGVKGTSKRP